MRDDLRHAIRFLWRRRGVSALAAATLAVGIGATTLIFSVADAALFKPLPYRDASRLVEVARVFRRATAEQAFQLGLNEREALLWTDSRVLARPTGAVDAIRHQQPESCGRCLGNGATDLHCSGGFVSACAPRDPGRSDRCP